MKQILLSIRMLLRFKVYTFINLIGLVFSVSCALIIARYIHQENNVDHFCPELERTFLMTTVTQNGETYLAGAIDRNNDPNFKNPLLDPSIEKVSQFIPFSDDYIMVNNRRFTVQTMIADSLFLEMMPYPVIEGNSTVHSPDDVIMTKKLATRLFKDESPIGKTLKTSTGNMVTVTGVIDEPSTKASMQFDLVISMELSKSWSRMENQLVQLHRPEDVIQLNQQNKVPMQLKSYSDRAIYYQLVPLKGFYTNTAVATYDTLIYKGNQTSLNILTLISFLLLLVGMFNYINLHTVVMLKRAREFGIKKVFGANGKTVFLQLYSENFSLGAIALLFIWTFVEITRGIVTLWFEIPVVADLRFDIWLSVFLLLGMPLLTTIFPFLRYNYAPPIHSLRSISTGGNSVVSRVIFLSVQYIITISLVIAAIYFSRQLHYVLHYDLNYKTQDIIKCLLFSTDRTYGDVITSMEEWEAKRKEEDLKVESVKRKMDESPLFTQWTYGDSPIQMFPPHTECTASTGEKAKISVDFVDQKYMELFDFKLKEGRIWDDEKDQFAQYKFIINETAKKVFHIEDINKTKMQTDARMWFSVGTDASSNPPYEIVGVIEDFKMGHLASPVYPLAFCYSIGGHQQPLLASIVPGKRKEAIEFLEKVFHEINGEGEFNYSFIENEIAALYHDDQRATRIYVTFAMIAILISCLGLFGLSLYDIQQRYREIALRKVNGATAHDIFQLLLRKYCYIFSIAFVLASCISYLLIHKYMESFYHHAPLSLWIFLTAGLLIALISLCTLGWQIHKAIKINPAKVLKGE
ncbi:ABC transporter permease [uncultured Bacteroides sp.]|uniref:ABC transporter permease n=1 Tax=uncultured Bacteroides sp. TaxID=162156 RepID=UPI0026015341|nr:ABC transporter permease [uncultured Bacteroides sp.]